MNTPNPIWTGTMEALDEHLRAWGDGTACSLESAEYDRQPPPCPMCGATGCHRNGCKTLENNS